MTMGESNYDRLTRITQRRRNFSLFVFLLLIVVVSVYGNPTSKGYIPFRTNPYDQPVSKNDPEEFRSDRSDDHQYDKKTPRFYEPDTAVAQEECPLQFSLGVSHRSDATAPGLGGNMGIQQPPIIYPILPWEGPGRQVLYATQYEHLGMLTPSKGNIHVSSSYSPADGEEAAGGGGNDNMNFIKEGLTEHVEFPLLFESSAFQTSPIIADVNGDGILDAILTDYHGGLYVIGLQVAPDQKSRYFFKAQVPRMYVRRQWIEAMVNETLGIDPYEAEKIAEEEEKKAEEARKASRDASAAGDEEPKDETDYDHLDQYRQNEERPHDPYHSYFEYSYGSGNADHETILRGVTGNVLRQDHDHVQGLEERRNRNHYPKDDQNQKVVFDSLEEDENNQKVVYDSLEEDENNQKVVYDSLEEDEKNQKVIYDSFEEDEKNQKVVYDSLEEDEKNQKVIFDSIEEDEKNQKIVYDSNEEIEADHRRLQEVIEEGDQEEAEDNIEGREVVDDITEWGGFADDMQRFEDDYIIDTVDDDDHVININNEDPDEISEGEENKMVDENGDEKNTDKKGDDDTSSVHQGDDDVYPHHDDYGMRDHGMYDDFYQGRYSDLHDDYFDDKHYIRLPPHILSTPVLAELPKMYNNNGETENLLFLGVSYYFDEDEYEGFFSYKRFEHSDYGDETETERGMYTANAIMIFHLGDNPRWGECMA
jgi:hypothetical protein